MNKKLLKKAGIKPGCPNCEIENNKNVPNTKIGVNGFPSFSRFQQRAATFSNFDAFFTSSNEFFLPSD